MDGPFIGGFDDFSYGFPWEMDVFFALTGINGPGIPK